MSRHLNLWLLVAPGLITAARIADQVRSFGGWKNPGDLQMRFPLIFDWLFGDYPVPGYRWPINWNNFFMPVLMVFLVLLGLIIPVMLARRLMRQHPPRPETAEKTVALAGRFLCVEFVVLFLGWLIQLGCSFIFGAFGGFSIGPV